MPSSALRRRRACATALGGTSSFGAASRSGAVAVLLVALVARGASAQTVHDEFPLVIHAGVVSSAEPTRNLEGELVLADRPFSLEHGYGYVGGRARQLVRAAVRGGAPDWPVAWRDDPQKYALRVPNGEYDLALSFVETDTAHRGVRVFGVQAEGRPLVEDLDIAAEAGDFTWLTLSFRVAVRDGWLDVDFRGADGRLPGRVSRLRLAPASPAAPLVAPTPRVTARYLANTVRWEPVPGAGVLGYGVFRAETPEGPFVSLTDVPVLGSSFEDHAVLRQASYVYRLRAYGIDGRQSPLSEGAGVVSSVSLPRGVRVFELRVPADDLPRLLTRTTPAEVVDGFVLYYGRSESARIRAETSLDDWQLRKSWLVELETGERFFGRDAFHFWSEPGDPTLLREALFEEVTRALGVPAPAVEPVRLVLNGASLGAFMNRERIDDRFRERHRLDDIGALVAAELRGDAPLDWRPLGDQAGGSGGASSDATLFAQELLRVHEGEVDAYLAERLYLDRVLARLAASAIAGREEGEQEERLVARDSRNGKWEHVAARAPEGAFGVRSFSGLPAAGGAESEAARARWALAGAALPGSWLPRPGWRLLDTRLLDRPALRDAYFERIESALDGELSPDAFDVIVERLAAATANALGAEVADLWPFDDGETFRAGPAAVTAWFRAHATALRGAIAAERARVAAEPVVIAELLLDPEPRERAEGEPYEKIVPSRLASFDGAWIELWNRSDRAVELGSYRLSTDPARPGEWALPAAQLGPGERRVVTLGSGGGAFHAPLRPPPGGGVLVLSRVDERGRATAADLVFYGHQTPGFAYARLDVAAGASGEPWAFQARPTPGGPPDPAADRLEPPTWRYSWSIDLEQQDGGVTISVKPGAPVEEVFFCVRPPGHVDFEAVPMDWNPKTFRHEHRVPRLEGDPALPFFFLARAESGLERTYPLTGSDLTFFTPSRPQVFINEVLPRPSKGGRFSEFVELYNAGDTPASVDGMYLSDKRRNTVMWRLHVPEPIPPKGFLVLSADGRGFGRHAPFKLSNSGEYLGLFHRFEEGNIPVDQMTFTAVPVDQSWGRREDGRKGFRRWRDPTPGRKNLPQIPEEYRKRLEEEAETEGGEAEGDGAGR